MTKAGALKLAISVAAIAFSVSGRAVAQTPANLSTTKDLVYVVKGKTKINVREKVTDVVVSPAVFVAGSNEIGEENMRRFLVFNGFGTAVPSSSTVAVRDCAEAIVTIRAEKGNVLPNDTPPGSIIRSDLYYAPEILSFICVNP